MFNHFFIIGSPRSGTSMLRLMLNSHNDISVPPECGFALWLSRYYDFTFNSFKLTHTDIVEELLKTRKFETWGIPKECILNISYNSYLDFVMAIYKEYSFNRRKDSKFFGDKNNYYIDHIDDLSRIFPWSKYIFIVRDGRDVYCSRKELSSKNIDSIYKPNLNSGLTESANEWTNQNKVVHERLGDDNVIFIRYEDLVINTTHTLNKICNFIGVEFQPEMLIFYKNNDEPSSFYQWKSKTFNPISSNSIGRYRNEMSDEEIKLYESIAREELKVFNYI